MKNSFKHGWVLFLMMVLILPMTSCMPAQDKLGSDDPRLFGRWKCNKFDYLDDNGDTLLSEEVSLTMHFEGYDTKYGGRPVWEEYEGHKPSQYLWGIQNGILTFVDHDGWITEYTIDVISDDVLILTQLNDQGIPSTRKYFKRVR